MKKKISILFGILICLTISIVSCVSKETIILNYLEKKYNEEFVIESSKTSSLLEDEFRGLNIIAHPKSNKNMPFNLIVKDSSYENFYDNYDLVKLSSQLNDDFKDIVKNSLGSKGNSKIFLYSTKQDNYNDMTLEDFLNLERDNISIHLNLVIEVDNNEDIKNNYSLIYDLLNKLKSYNVELVNINVGFVGDIENKNIEEYFRLSSVVGFSWDKLNGDIYGEMRVSNREEINSEYDLDKYVERFKEE